MKKSPLKRKTPLNKIYNPTTGNSYPVFKKLAQKGKVNGLWKTPLKKVSKKMQAQKRQENKLSAQLLELSGGVCEICHTVDWRGLAKHEAIKRSQQGSEISPLNTLLICGNCHDHVKYPKSGTPLSIDEQLELAKKLHSCLVKSEE